MSKPRIIVTRRWPEAVERHLEEHYDAQLNGDDRPMSAAELREAFATADAVLPTVSDRITAEVMDIEPLRARVIANFGVGFNHIDLEAAKARGLTVTNTPEVLTDCTADLTMTLLLMAARRAGEGERHLRGNEWTGWRPTHMMGAKVTGKTIGLIGMGRIGKAVAVRAHHGFGMKVIFYDRYPVDPQVAASLGAESCGTVEEVIQRADFVSLHCPGGEENYHLMNAERIALMQPHAFLINSARGDVVDEAALAAALKSGGIAGAGLDVYEGEPKVNADLLGLENVVLLPHLGSASLETREAMGMRVAANLKAFFAGETPPDKVV
jgi:lactate dehydrogenase-like 2-hydroxyacid dehydrogenase